MESITTKPMTPNQELENCLNKAISKYDVRDMLTKFGIPEDAEVTLKMQIGENSEPLTRCLVEKEDTAKETDISRGSMSLTSLHDSLITKFINPAIKDLDLMEFIAGVGGSIDNDENKLIIGLNSKNSICKMDLIFISCCCCTRSNGRCCKVGRNCSQSCCPC